MTRGKYYDYWICRLTYTFLLFRWDTITTKLMRIDKPKGFTCIPGVELDAIYCGSNVHILAYNIDLYDNNFTQFVNHNAELLEQTNIELVSRLSKG